MLHINIYTPKKMLSSCTFLFYFSDRVALTKHVPKKQWNGKNTRSQEISLFISFRCPKAVAFNKPTKKSSEKHMLSRKLPRAFFSPYRWKHLILIQSFLTCSRYKILIACVGCLRNPFRIGLLCHAAFDQAAIPSPLQAQYVLMSRICRYVNMTVVNKCPNFPDK